MERKGILLNKFSSSKLFYLSWKKIEKLVYIKSFVINILERSTLHFTSNSKRKKDIN